MSTAEEEDGRLRGAFDTLSPSADAVARMEVRVLEGHEKRSQSLWSEWWNLLRARPIANGALVAAAALILFFTTPLSLLPGLFRPSAEEQHASAELEQERSISQPAIVSREARIGALLHRNKTAVRFRPASHPYPPRSRQTRWSGGRVAR
jgi:hypothetical protein